MTHSIITSQKDGSRDADLTEITRQLQKVLKNEGRFDPRVVGRKAAEIAAQYSHRWSAEQQQAVLAYIDTLAEPDKTIILKRRDGMKPSQIAESMGLSFNDVLNSLVRCYTDLKDI